MIDYQVSLDKKNNSFIVYGQFDPNSLPIEIPESKPYRKQFIDLFLHKADIERGIDFLQCISIDKSATVNEGLFIAGLNNCMKCFKYSQARSKLDKTKVFSENEQMLQSFLFFENMRDKHFDHDENGMLQATAFLLIYDNDENMFGGPPSVVWNRAELNYYFEGIKLQEIMQFVREFIIKEIDTLGNQIEEYYRTYTKEELMKLKTPKIELASSHAQRK